MNGLDILMKILICIVCVLFCIKEISLFIINYTNSKKIQQSIRDLDDLTVSAKKEIMKQSFFNEVEELQMNNKEKGDKNGKQE